MSGGQPKLGLQRIRVNAQGYDADGAYWGAGPDAFIVSVGDSGNDEITVRAKTAAEARQKAIAELERRPDQKRSRAEPHLGGRANRVTRFTVAWAHPSTAKRIEIRITHARNYLTDGTDHIEIESIAPKRAAFPLSETGYLSHFIDAHQLRDAGGPVAFVDGWLARETRSKDWQKKDLARQQGDLFQWADANAEAGKRKPAAKRPARPRGPKPRTGRTPR